MLIPKVSEILSETHHGDAARQQRSEELAEDWAAWVSEIRANGIMEPIRVVPNGDGWLAVDGRHRLAAALEIGLEEVPVVEVSEEEAAAVIEGSVSGRRHWTKSMRAYFAVLVHPEVATERRHGGDRKSTRIQCALNNDDLASRFGVSPRLLDQAIELYRLIEAYPEFRDRIEPSLWGGASLAGLIQGMRALTDPVGSTGPGKTIVRHHPGKLDKIWASEKAHARNWHLLDEDHRTIMRRRLESELAELPEDYLRWKFEIMAAHVPHVPHVPNS